MKTTRTKSILFDAIFLIEKKKRVRTADRAIAKQIARRARRVRIRATRIRTLLALLAICFASPPFASRAPRFAGISWLERSLQAWHGLCHSSSSYSSMHATCRSRKALARRARSASVRICGSPYRGGHDGVISSLVLPRTFALSSLFASHLLPSLRALLDSPSFAPRCPRFVTFVLLASLRGGHPDGVCLRRACFSVSSSTDGTPVCPCGCAGACGRIWCASNRRCVWLVCVDESVHL